MSNDSRSFLKTETMRYFVKTKKLLDSLSRGDKYNDELIVIKSQVLQEIIGIEYACATNPVASRVLEKIIFSMEPVEVFSLFITLSENIVELSLHQCGSHLVEKILNILIITIDLRENQEYFPQVISTIKILIKKSRRLFSDNFGNFVTRSLFEFLAHFSINDRIKSKKFERGSNENRKSTKLLNKNDFFIILSKNFDREVYGKLLKRFLTKFNKYCFSNPFKNDNLAIMHCYAILAAFNINQDLFQNQMEILKTFLKEIFSDSEFSVIIGNTVKTFLFQIIFTFCENDKLIYKIHKKFCENLPEILNDKISSNMLINSVYSLNSTEILSKMTLDYIKSIYGIKFPDQVISGLFGFIVERLGLLGITYEERGIVGKILECYGNDEFIFHSIITLKKAGFNVQRDDLMPVSCHLLSSIFKIFYSELLIKSVMNLKSCEIVKILSHASGSRVFDSFVESEVIDDQIKCDFISKLEDRQFVNISKNIYGCFWLEKIWKYLPQNRFVRVSSVVIGDPQFKMNQNKRMIQNGIDLFRKSQLKRKHSQMKTGKV